MSAQLIINQVGLPPGSINQARSDGLHDGSPVTLSSVGPGDTHTLELLWAPEDDTLAAASFSQNTTNTATFTPDPDSIGGTYRIKLTVVDGLNTSSVIRCFAILTDNAGLRIPALNERANEAATLASGPALVEDSEFNEPSASGPFAGGNYGGWYKAIADTIRAVETGGGGGGGGGAPADAGYIISSVSDSRLPNSFSLNAQDNIQASYFYGPDYNIVNVGGRSPAFTMYYGDIANPDITPQPNIMAGTTLWIDNGPTAFTARSLQAPFSPYDIFFAGNMLTITIVNKGTANMTFLHHGAAAEGFFAFDCPGGVSRVIAPGQTARVMTVYADNTQYWQFLADPFTTNGIVIAGNKRMTGATASDSGISVYAGLYGGTAIILASGTDAANKNRSALYLFKYMYDNTDTYTPPMYLGGSSDFIVFSRTANNTLGFKANDNGTAAISLFSSK